jgi:class 3 adenylate cyclase
MALSQDLSSEVKEIFSTNFTTRAGIVVPEAEDIRLGNDAVVFDEAVVLYADLAGSTALVKDYRDWFAAEVYKSYLHCASKIIRDQGGTITAFDGDRVMAVFIGDSKRTNAAKAALKINHAVVKIINPIIKEKFPTTEYFVKHGVGADISKLFVARTGIRGSNDLVWVGPAANYAAKLCSLREDNYASYITAAVYDKMAEEAKVGGDPKQNMWEKRTWTPYSMEIYRSSWMWSP